MKSHLDALMSSAEKGPQFRARQDRPHLAQEYRENQKPEDAESICFPLTSHARLCARGELGVRHEYDYHPWWRTKQGRQEVIDAVR